jgi:hypothetical protein
MRPTRRTVLEAIGLLALAGAAPAPEPRPTRATCTLRKDEDRCEVKIEPGAVVVTITSKSGIGGATVDTGGTPAPRRLVLRFPGLRSLEGFKVHDGTVGLEGRLGFGENGSMHRFDAGGREVKEDKDAVYRLEVRRLEKPGAIEVTLKYPDEARDGRKWKVEWVDAYR